MHQFYKRAEYCGSPFIQLINWVILHVLVKQINITYVDAGQETLLHHQKRSFKVLFHIGFSNLGRKRNEQGIFQKMYGV